MDLALSVVTFRQGKARVKAGAASRSHDFFATTTTITQKKVFRLSKNPQQRNTQGRAGQGREQREQCSQAIAVQDDADRERCNSKERGQKEKRCEERWKGRKVGKGRG